MPFFSNCVTFTGKIKESIGLKIQHNDLNNNILDEFVGC